MTEIAAVTRNASPGFPSHFEAASVGTLDGNKWETLSPRDQWLKNPKRAFAFWIETRIKIDQRFYSERSKVQHKAMWNTFVTYLESINVSALDAGAVHVARFLDSLKAKKRSESTTSTSEAKVGTKVRYAKFLRDVYNHLRNIEARFAENPCPAIVRQFAQQPERVPTSLWIQHHQKFVDKVLAKETRTWLDVRDQAILVLIVGSGLYLGELLSLRVDALRLDGPDPHIVVDGHGRVPPRLAPILPFAIGPLKRWLELRASLNVNDELVFFSRKRTARTNFQMSGATIYKKVRAVLDDATGEQVRSHGGKGPQVLRNAFLLRQIEKKKPIKDIQEWAGHVLEKSTRRFERLIPYRNGVKPE